MTTGNPASRADGARSLRRRVQDTDRRVGLRLRERRLLLGLTQQELAELLGVTYQQAHKYEKGVNRIAAGRLFTLAQVLGVEVGYFFEGLGGGAAGGFRLTGQQRLLLELTRSFTAIADGRQRAALCDLARALATAAEPAADGEPHAGALVLAGCHGKDAA